MKIFMFAVVILVCGMSALADDTLFSKHLYAKFQVRACTNCHDYFEKELGGLSYKSHKGRSADMCIYCHTEGETGFKHTDDWFAQPGLYTSGMDAQKTCETIKTAMHAKFKNKTMLARQMEIHLFEDPRVLWGIEGATPKSGMLPTDRKENDLIKEGLPKWKHQVGAWIKGGMKCQ